MKRFWIGVLVLVIVCLAGFAAYAWKPAIDPIEPPQRSSFDQALIEKGAVLASVGNCTACHTKPGGKSFAGGLAVPTPFGTIYSTNITPDPKTGIGRWSEAAFSRAMREGVERNGDHLYPAFPFDHFTLVSDQDNKALYAYLMTRHAVESRPPANELPFPLNMRFVLHGLEAALLRQGGLSRGYRAECRLEPRRLSRRRAWPLRRLPHAAQHHGRRAEKRASGWRRSGGLGCLPARQIVFRAYPVDA
ncbi:c-type cytochrome [Mesorhizobium atlanticum]